MATVGTLYSYLPNARCLKVGTYAIQCPRWNTFAPLPPLTDMEIFAAARIGGVNIDTAPDYQHMATNKTPEFLAKFPIGKVPAFEASDGAAIAESDAIAQYVAESGAKAAQLLGADARERAKVRQWINFTDNEVYGNMMAVVLCRAGYAPYVPEKESAGAQGLSFALGVVEKYLKNRVWLATDQLSLADLTLASALYWAFMHYLDETRRQAYPVTTEWYLRTIGAEGAKEVFGPPNLVISAKEF